MAEQQRKHLEEVKMSSPSILKKLGDKAKHYRDMAKTLPLDDSTTAGLRAVAENVSG